MRDEGVQHGRGWAQNPRMGVLPITEGQGEGQGEGRQAESYRLRPLSTARWAGGCVLGVRGRVT